MPGAPWRSQGCNTCRKRKVKCDLQRPECARCLRGGHHCKGYDRTAKFIHTFVEPNDPQTLEIQQKPKRSRNKLQPPPANVPTIVVVNVNAQIRSQLFSVFIDSYVPSSASGQISFRCQRSSNLIESFPSLMDRPRSQLLDRAIAALASVFVGKKFNDERMINNGIRIYNQAIQIFVRLIPRSDLPVQEVLCANLVFQLYELINCSSGFSGWMAHMEGANAVLARHHQKLEGDQMSKMLLRHLKLANIFHAIGKSKSALASCPMWQMLTPLENDNDLIDEIIDILMHCTVLVELVGGARSERETRRLKKLCWRLKHRTDSWYEQLRSLFGDPLYTSIPDETDIARSGRIKAIYTSRYQFPAVEIAEAHSLYWAAQLITYSLLFGLELLGGSFAQHGTPLSIQSGYPSNTNSKESELYMEEAEFCADQICRGVAYLIQPDMHILGGENLLFPVAMAAQFFHGNGFHDKYEWCQEVFIALESLGIGLSHVLQGTPWSDYKSGQARTL
ncbi:hypothetical protein N7533_002254 [Penicillium manginii]|uniref:uncharacterized protein n=1 Tax=Penicillium manginii TaxID=203109 RepID=UPI00254743E7|nr:uncharacterized protein N7533_002254 [Penicillium manginii]KAJ5763573.1 hypothetical protein N7533_002254 [Penicillium manginii]